MLRNRCVINQLHGRSINQSIKALGWHADPCLHVVLNFSLDYLYNFFLHEISKVTYSVVKQSTSYKAILKKGQPKQKFITLEFGFRISPKFGTVVADGMLFICA